MFKASTIFVATVPTVYGIETAKRVSFATCDYRVATVPTVYGIETNLELEITLIKHTCVVATVPTVYGIETLQEKFTETSFSVATVPTVYGIETSQYCLLVAVEGFTCCNSTYRLRY